MSSVSTSVTRQATYQHRSGIGVTADGDGGGVSGGGGIDSALWRRGARG